MDNRKVRGRKLATGVLKFIGLAVVAIWLGSASVDFFAFVTPPERWWFAYLGFGLTGGGMILNLILFRWDAETSIQKTTSLVMFVVCMIGELATAGFGFQVEAWRNGGYEIANSDFDFMVIVMQLLGAAHAISLTAYLMGDKVADYLDEVFGDEDGDGTPNYKDADWKRKQVVGYAKTVEQPQNPTNPPRQ